MAVPALKPMLHAATSTKKAHHVCDGDLDGEPGVPGVAAALRARHQGEVGLRHGHGRETHRELGSYRVPAGAGTQRELLREPCDEIGVVSIMAAFSASIPFSSSTWSPSPSTPRSTISS